MLFPFDVKPGWHPVKGMNSPLSDCGKAFTVKGLRNRFSGWFSHVGRPTARPLDAQDLATMPRERSDRFNA
jgi:hypothetical protein